MADAKIRLSVDGSSQVISEFSRVESKIGSLNSVVERAKQSLSVLGVGLGVNEIARLSDEYTKYTAQLKLATTSETQYANARAEVSRIAKASQSDLANTGTLYARIANGTRELGVTQQKVGEITEAVTLSLKASGATQAESASATLQLSQAFAAGALRGEEFNAVSEASPRLMKALADGLGVPVGALKEMATEGKLTSQVMAETLPKALEDLRKEASQVETISGAMTNLKSSVMEMVGAQAQHNGTAALLSTTINTLANNLNYVTAAAAGFTAIKVSEKIVDIITSTRASIVASNELSAAKARETAATLAAAEANVVETTAKVAHLVEARAAIVAAREDAIAKLSVANASITAAQAQIQAATSAGALSAALAAVRQGEISLAAAMQTRAAVTTELAILGQQQAVAAAQATTATAAQAAAQAGLGAASTAAAAGTGLLSRALGFLGGPVGAVITVLGLGVSAWMAWGSSSEKANEQSQKATEESTNDAIARIGKEVEVLRERNKLRDTVPTVKNAKEADLNALARAKKDYEDAQKGEGKAANMTLTARIELLRTTGIAYGKLINEVQALANEQTRVSEIAKSEKLKKWFGENGTQAQRMTAAMEAARKEVGVLTPEMEKLIRAKFADKKISDEVREANELGSAAATAAKKAEAEITKKFAADLKDYAQDQIAYTKDVTKEIIANIDSQGKAYLSIKKSLDDQAIAMAETNELAQLESGLLGESNVVRATLIEQKKIELRLEKQIREIRASNLDEGQKNLLIDQANSQALIEKSSAGLQAEQKEWSKFYGEIYTGLTDSLYRSFESGKSFGKTFIDSIKNLFKTTVLKLAVQGIVTGVLGMGTIGQANAGQSASNMLGNPSSLMSMGQSLWEGFASAGAASSSTFTSFALSSMGQSLGLSSTTAASAMAAEAAALTGSTIGTSATSGAVLTGAGSAGASVATAMPYVMAAIAAFQGVKSVNGDYRIGGLSADAGALLGIAPRLFGMKEKEMGGQTVTGTLGTDNLMRNQAWSQDGGVFRSDRSGVWSYGLKDSVAVTSDGKSYTDSKNVDSDKALLAVLNGGYAAVKTAATDFAKALGLNADEIAKRNDSLNLTLGKTKEENDKALAGVFSGVADSIASSLIPNIKSLQKEGETSAAAMARLATGLVGVNNTISAIGFDKMSGTVEGANAAQRLLDASGGMEKFATNAAYFSENFLSEAQKIKPSMDLVASTLADLGMTNIKTIEDFRLAVVGGKDASGNLVKGLDLTTEAGAKTYARMMDLAPQFIAVTEYTAELDAKLASTNAGIQEQIDALTKAGLSREEQRKLETAGMADSTKQLQELLYARQDEAEAAAKAKEAADKLATTNANLQARIDSLTFAKLSEAEQRKLETAGMAESTLKLQNRVYALEDEAAATAKVKEAADKLAETNANLQSRIDSLTFAKLSEAEQRKLETAGMADSTLKLQERVYALEDEAAATAKVKEAADKLATTNANLQARIDSLMFAKLSEAEQRKLETAGMADSTLKLQNRVYALEDEAAATAKVKEAADKLANTNANLQARIDSLTLAKLSEAEQRKLETAGMADSTLKLQERVYALEDEAAATAKAKDAIEKLKATNATIQDQIDAIVRAALPLEEQRKLEVIGLDDTTIALKKQYWALQDNERALLDKAALEKQLLDDQVKAKQAAESAFASWMSDVKAAFSRDSGVFKDIINQFTDLARSMETYAESLVMGPAALLSPEAQYLANKSKFESVSALAKTGDKDAIGQLKNVSDAFLESSRKYNASSQAYFDDLNKVKAAVADSTVAAYAQVDLAKLQLNLLEQQVAGLVDINDSVKTVADILSGKVNDSASSKGQTALSGYSKDVTEDIRIRGGSQKLLDDAMSGDPYGRRNLQLLMARWNSQGLKAEDMDAIIGKGWLDKFIEALGIPKGLFGDQINFSKYMKQNMQQIPGFANGGNASGIVMVGEKGPELINLGSTSRVHTNRETNDLLSSKSDPETKRILREQNRLMEQILDQLKLGDNSNRNKLDAIKNGFVDIKRAADFAKARVP